MRQYLIPGVGFINETGANEYLIPGSVYLNETVPPATGTARTLMLLGVGQ